MRRGFVVAVLMGALLIVSAGCKKEPTEPEKKRCEEIFVNGKAYIPDDTSSKVWRWELNKGDTLITTASTEDGSLTLYAGIWDKDTVCINESPPNTNYVSWTVEIFKTYEYLFGVATYEEWGEYIVVYAKKVYWE